MIKGRDGAAGARAPGSFTASAKIDTEKSLLYCPALCQKKKKNNNHIFQWSRKELELMDVVLQPAVDKYEAHGKSSRHFYPVSLWPQWGGSEGLSGLTGRQWGSHQPRRNNALNAQKQEVDKQYLSSGFLFEVHLFWAANPHRDAEQHSCLRAYRWGSFISKQSSDLLTRSTLRRADAGLELAPNLIEQQRLLLVFSLKSSGLLTSNPSLCCLQNWMIWNMWRTLIHHRATQRWWDEAELLLRPEAD